MADERTGSFWGIGVEEPVIAAWLVSGCGVCWRSVADGWAGLFWRGASLVLCLGVGED